MEDYVQHVLKQVSEFDGENADDFMEWSSKLRVSLSIYNNTTFETVNGRSGHQSWITIRQPLARVEIMSIIICTATSTSRHPAQLPLS